KTNDSTPTGKNLMDELCRHHTSVEFENQSTVGVKPDGYFTSEEFVKRGKEKIVRYYKENGLL
ncbi:MAG: hypothetical protein PHT07_23600, partial [Paludibacter sp.]|nr:hypothetical protein [Paludibacter sp.]